MRDPRLFLHTFAPHGVHLTFIDMPIEEFTQAYFEWKREINAMCEFPWEVEKELVSGALTNKFESMLPLVKGVTDKSLILETQSNWLAYYSNGLNGGDVAGPMRHMGRTLKIRTLTVMYHPDNSIDKVGGLSFWYKDWQQGEPIVRSVQTYRDGSWEFLTYGEPFPFEETQNYTAKKIKDRLTIDMVERYLRHFGIEWFDPDFYEGKAYLIRGYPLPNATYFDEFPNQQRQSE